MLWFKEMMINVVFCGTAQSKKDKMVHYIMLSGKTKCRKMIPSHDCFLECAATPNTLCQVVGMKDQRYYKSRGGIRLNVGQQVERSILRHWHSS